VSFLPATLILLLWWKRERLVWRVLWPLLVMLGIVAGMGQLTLHIERLHGATGDAFHMSLLERVLVSGRSFWFYLGKLVFPHPLLFVYERWQIDPRVWWQYACPVATVGMLAGLWLGRGRIGRGPFVGLLHFYMATSMLVLIQVLYMMRYTFVSDHWQYFGCMGVMAVAAAGTARMFDQVRAGGRYLKGALCGVLLLLLGVLTWRQCGMYADIETLWRTTLVRNPNANLANNNLGYIYLERGRVDMAIACFQRALIGSPNSVETQNNLGIAFRQIGQMDEAFAHFKRALEINPDYADTHYNFGNALLQVGRVDEAIIQFQKALKLKPDYVSAYNNLGDAFKKTKRIDEATSCFKHALEIDPDSFEAGFNLGTILMQIGRTADAIPCLQRAVEINPAHADAHNNLGLAFLQSGRVDEACTHFQKALELKPDLAQAHLGLGMAFLQKGRVNEAVTHYQKALAIQPRNIGLLNRLAWVLATAPEFSLRDGNRAVELARQANQLSGGENPAVLQTLAAAYAESGRFAEAIATVQQALQLAVVQSNLPMADALHAQIGLYQAGSPFRDPGPTNALPQNQP
jgi:protein O-mannosyl-transferase